MQRLNCTVSCDTIDARVMILNGNRYAQVFATKFFFIQKKRDCHLDLMIFAKQYGAPKLLIHDGSPQQVGIKTIFQSLIRKYDIRTHVREAYRPSQNVAEGAIRELRKKLFNELFKTNCQPKLWDFAYKYISTSMCLTYGTSRASGGQTPLEILTGETSDISEYLDFGFYDSVWFKENARLGEVKMGRFIGVSHMVGSLMC